MSIEELLRKLEAQNEVIAEQYETILWLNRYIRNLEEMNERERKCKRYEPFG